jgi:hypothetical protein
MSILILGVRLILSQDAYLYYIGFGVPERGVAILSIYVARFCVIKANFILDVRVFHSVCNSSPRASGGKGLLARLCVELRRIYCFALSSRLYWFLPVEPPSVLATG